MRAVVLAAGRGVRMGGETPKTLLPVGTNDALLHYILTGLAIAGVDDLLVVTGHRHVEIQDYVTANWKGPEAMYVRNARFASWGNFHSVRVAVDQSPGLDLLIVNSDVVVNPKVYRRVADTRGDLVLAVEKRFTLDNEDMRVRLDGSSVRAVSKHLKKAFSHGEYTGVSLIRPRAAALYLELSTDAEWQGDTTIYYEDIYDRMLGRCDARAALIETGEYAEIDEPEDVFAASNVILAHKDAWGTS
ncbi:MAG TPA: NTP transferase domain-containing protein [Actinomycetota bacterium]|nr:NTP transferase domain-containing protein [Actinomycetota bacterium]